MQHKVRITIEFEMNVSDVEVSREVLVESLGDLGPHAQIEIELDKMYEAERLLKEGASYNETSATVGMTTRTLRKYFPGYGMTQAEGAKWRELKQIMDEATLTPSPARKKMLQEKAPLAEFCKKGLHRMSGDNVLIWKGNHRRCRACRNEYKRASRSS